MSGTLTMFYHICSFTPERLTASIEAISVSGECMTEKTAKCIREEFKKSDIYNIYGLTEASPRVTYLLPELFDSYPLSVGFPLNSITAKIKDGELFGLKSTCPSNTRLTNGYDLLNWVMRMSGVPSFWGRYMTGANKLTTEEIEFLHNNYCGIALIYNEFTEADVNVKNGIADGLYVANIAKGLGVPKHHGIALYVEIHDDWSINHNWMIGYANAVLDSGYNPGFIANTDSSVNFNFGRQCSHYAQFFGDIAKSSTSYWGYGTSV